MLKLRKKGIQSLYSCPGLVILEELVLFCFLGNSSVSSSQPIPSSQIPSSQPVMCSFNPSPILQSAGLLTLGKLCLQNEKLAKQVVPALGKLLGSSSEPALKNNIVHVLCDIIIRLTNYIIYIFLNTNPSDFVLWFMTSFSLHDWVV